ncbi:MAG: FAD-binding domain [Myxococcales bacterium]|nr:FAD-binding domain [Myxococcales bacterium]
MRIAINGAGIAGPTLAYWLRRHGHEPVLFESAPALRTGGYLIDFWGVGYEVARRMGLEAKLQERGYAMQRLSLVDSEGEEVSGMGLDTMRDLVDGKFTTIARGDLAELIYDACEGVETHFGTFIVEQQETDRGMSTLLSNGENRDFDLVIGADGLHSHVRRLMFGNTDCEKPLGVHVAAFRVKGYPRRDELTYVSHTVLERQIARVSLRDDETLFLLTFRSELMREIPKRDEVKPALHDVFKDVGWEMPEILQHLARTDDLYFDSASQIHLDRWTNGRAALIGDAAACPSLLAGEGTGLAMTEAYVLAGELHRAGGDHTRAFAEYEKQLQGFLEDKQRAALKMASYFAPESKLAIKIRDWGIALASYPFLTKLIAGRAIRDDYQLPAYPEGEPS